VQNLFSMLKRGLFILIVCALFSGILRGRVYHKVSWNEIETDNFIVVYPESYYKEANSTLLYAELTYNKFSTLLNFEVKEKIRLLLTDFSDVFSSSSTIFPYCIIKINLATYFPDRIYGGFKNPYEFFLTKEISKIFLSKLKRGPINSLRTIFGNHPLLSPLLFTPSPITEGFINFLALYINNETNYINIELILKKIADKKTFPQFSKLSGNYSKWPLGHSKLVFGTSFFLFLSKSYNINSLINFLESYVLYPIKYTTSHRMKIHFKNSQQKIWNDFYNKYKKTEKVIKIKQSTTQKKFNIIDNSGNLQRFPLFIKKKTIFYLKNDFVSPVHFTIKGQTQKSIILDGKDITGVSFDKYENKIYFSSAINTTPYLSYSDIFVYDIESNEIKQISFGQRVFSPVKIHNKDELLCIKKYKNKFYLSFFNLKSKKIKIISKKFQTLSHPKISPDNKLIVCSIKNKNNFWRIGIFNINGKFIKYITDKDRISYYPEWRNNNEIFYISEFNKNNVLHSYNLLTDEYTVYQHPVLNSLKYFSFSDNGENIVCTYLKYNGYNTAFTGFSNFRKKQIDYDFKDSSNSNILKQLKSLNKVKTKKYNYLRDLTPKYFTPIFSYAGNEIQPGIYTSGSDLLGNNEYNLSLFYVFKNKSISYDFNYKFNALFQDIGISSFDKFRLNQDMSGDEYLIRTIATQIYIKHPFVKTKNHAAYFVFDLHFEKISSKFNGVAIYQSLINNTYNGIGLSLLYKSSKTYYNSISNNDGFDLSLTFSKELKALGSTRSSNTFFFEYKHFFSIFRPNVLSFRLGIIKSSGEYKRGFFMGGAQCAKTTDSLKDNFFGLMRGYPAGFFYGTQGYLINSEYRISLLNVEDTVLFLPYIEKIYLTLFSDIGELSYNNTFKKPSISLGLEFNVKFNLPFSITLACGAAKGINPSQQTILYLRLENSF